MGRDPRMPSGYCNSLGLERYSHGSADLGALAVGCAHVPSDPEARAEYEQNNDPAEPTNRTIFAGNQFVDHHALQPVARGYEDYVPGRVRNSIHNFVGNLGPTRRCGK